jgi:hypothetical protein
MEESPSWKAVLQLVKKFPAFYGTRRFLTALTSVRHVLASWRPYLLTPWSRVLLEKLTGLLLVKKFPAIHRTRRFLTTLTSARHLSLSWASPMQSSHPHPTSWSSILILSSHLCLGFPSGLFPSGFHTKTLYTPLPSPTRATCPTHLILLDFITRTRLGKEYRSFNSSLCNFLHSPVTSSHNFYYKVTFYNAFQLHTHHEAGHVKHVRTQRADIQ